MQPSTWLVGRGTTCAPPSIFLYGLGIAVAFGLSACGLILDDSDAYKTDFAGPGAANAASDSAAQALFPTEGPLTTAVNGGGSNGGGSTAGATGKDAVPLPISCAAPVDSHTLLLLPFNGPPAQRLVDASARHDIIRHGSLDFDDSVDRSCGEALELEDSNDANFIEVPDSSDWQLDEGAVDFWVYLTHMPGNRTWTILSRDELSTNTDGHFGVNVTDDGELQVRLQPVPAGSVATVDWYATGAKVRERQWAHVLINFGAPSLQLYLDGKLVFERARDTGIAGNINPWAIGAGTHISDPGKVAPHDRYFDGRLDHIRISNRRRAPYWP
ncbi:MAG: LamG domain-containing protein [Polyangiales bacterium]